MSVDRTKIKEVIQKKQNVSPPSSITRDLPLLYLEYTYTDINGTRVDLSTFPDFWDGTQETLEVLKDDFVTRIEAYQINIPPQP